MIRILGPLAILALAACAPLNAPDSPPPDYSLRKPRDTTTYLRWSVENESAFHLYNCLSTHFRTKYDVKLSELDFFWSTAKERILEYVGGDFANVEVENEEVIDANTRDLTYVSGPHRAVVRFVREKDWDLDYLSVRRPAESGEIADMAEVLRIEDGRAILSVPIQATDAEADDVYRMRLRAEWRIHDVIEHNLDEVRARP
ncbi:MAG: hypothetical protein R3F20_05900 [Planctomycetota bacterium]